MMKVLKMVMVVLGLVLGLGEAKLFSLTAGWTVTRGSSISFTNGNFWPLLANSTSITSSQSTFALGLFGADLSTTVTMIICLLPFKSSTAIDVWNSGKAFRRNVDSVLRVSDDGSQLQLVDADSKIVWSVGGNVSALELTESGNMVIYNSSKGVLWQSFDHPNDTWLPGQILKEGMQLTAANSSYSANYSFVVEPAGGVLYSTNSDLLLPYWVYTFEGQTSNYSSAIQKCGDSKMIVEYQKPTDYQNDVFLLNRSGSCNLNTTISIPLRSTSKFRLLRLESDGNLRHRYWNDGDLSINAEVFGPRDTCLLPDFCGSYGVCSGGQCSCPIQSADSSDSSLKNAFPSTYSNSDSDSSSSLDSDSDNGCPPVKSLACDASSMSNHKFFKVSDVTYFPNKYLHPLNLTNREDCLSFCLSNCSCSAAFYEDSTNKSAKACYHFFGRISTLELVSSEDSQKNYSAYLKVQISPHKNSVSRRRGAIITISSAAAVAFILLIQTAALLKGKFCRKSVEDDFLKSLPSLPRRFSLKELETATNGFRHKLGAGGFGPVFAGKLTDGRSVAVKRLQGVRQGRKEFEAEVTTLAGISHVNLVRLYGFCIEGANRLLVYESMSNGSLDKWLFVDNPMRVLPWSSRMAIAMDTAEGLAYLHEECSVPVLHLDIKPQNILLGENFKAKVSDFGMAKLVNEEIDSMVTEVRGTPGYLAPEWPLHSIVMKKCDVYSYGIVVLEMISGRRVLDPYCGSSRIWYLPSWALLKTTTGEMLEIVDPKLGKSFDSDEAVGLIRLACWCIQQNPGDRPSMLRVVQMLHSISDIPDPPLFNPMLPISDFSISIHPISCTDQSPDTLSPR